jgi:Tfp pilus assembly protein PilX
MNKNSTQKQSGAVSLFVVLFAMLLLSVVALSFGRLMVDDQQRAVNSNLSRNAYDSAQAGTEDAKRALAWYQRQCISSSSACLSAAAVINNTSCNTALRSSGIVNTGSGSGEVVVQTRTSSVDRELNQAYTCVTMQLDTDDVVGQLPVGESRVVPLVPEKDPATGKDVFYDQVRISWFRKDDVASGKTDIDRGNAANPPQQLIGDGKYADNRPSVLRAQTIQVGTNFTLPQFDGTVGASGAQESNTNSVFMYPTGSGGNSFISIVDRDVRRDMNNPDSLPLPDSPADSPLPVSCASSFNTATYACSLVVHLPYTVGRTDRTAYLRLAAFYNSAHFKVELLRSNPSGPSTLVKFGGVQPTIDSTGRANDMFRRVQSRVDLYDTQFPFPDAAVDVTGNFCKDFAVSDTTYYPGTCTP